MSTEPLTYRVIHAAQLVGVSKYLLYEAIKTGDLPVVRLHPKAEMRILADDLHGWLARNRSAATATR